MPRPVSILLAMASVLALSTHTAAAPAAQAGTLDQLVAKLDAKVDRALGGEPSRRLDLALAVRTGPQVSNNLVMVLERLLIERLSHKGLRSVARWSSPPPAAACVKRARIEGFELLLDLTATIVGGYLHLRGELQATDTLIWRDVSLPARRTLSHLHARIRVDAEVRAFSGQLKPSRLTLSEQRVALGHRPAVALACDDFDNDGRAELAVLTPRAVEIYRRAGSSLGRVTRSALKPPLAVVAPRRDLGELHVLDVDGDGKRELVARSSRLAMAVELSFDGRALATRRSLNGFPLIAQRRGAESWWLTADLSSGLDYFAATSLQATPPRQGWTPTTILPATFYALRGASIASPKRARQAFAASVDLSGQLNLYDGALSKIIATHKGAGVAFDLADIDDDGTLEVITTDATSLDEEDSVSIYRLNKGKLQLTWRSGKLGGRVMAVTHGDLDGDGRREVLCAVTASAGMNSSDDNGKTVLVIFK